MPIELVAPDEPVKASTQNAMINHYNATMNRVIFTANGAWSLPEGINRFKVTLCGGGGGGSGGTYSDGESPTFIPGGVGGNSPMVSIIVSGQDPGTSFGITIGAGGSADASAGGTTSFGTLLVSTGGGPAGGFPGFAAGSWGSATFPGGAPTVYHNNDILRLDPTVVPGKGGSSGTASVAASNGGPGICIIEF